jgi:elongation factor P
MEDNILGIELPASVDLEIIETAPGIKGSSATARTFFITYLKNLEVELLVYSLQSRKNKS